MANDDRDAEAGPNGALFELYEFLASQIGSGTRYADLQVALMEAIEPFAHVVHANARADHPVELSRSRIVNQANNDFVDLLYESLCGRGRPAIRSSRSLFEHLVNQRWTTARPTEAQRYLDHGSIGELLDLELNTPSETDYSGDDRRRVRHWRHKLERRIVPAATAAIAKYGSSFRRSWSTTSLRDRADALGLGHDYDMYRLLSAVVHGAAGGDLGHRAEIDGTQVLRTGPAVAACPLAFRAGLTFYRALVDDVQAATGSGACLELETVLAELVDTLDTHKRRCISVDHQMWPSEAPVTSFGLRVEPDGTRTWFLLDPDGSRTIEAEPVNPDSADLARLDSAIAGIETANPGRTKPMIIAVSSLRGAPKAGATWRPAEDTLGPSDAYAGALKALLVREPQWDPSLHR